MLKKPFPVISVSSVIAPAQERAQFEPLEGRVLNAANWGAFPHQIHQDAAAGDYPTIIGTGQTIAVLDTGVNYQNPSLANGSGPWGKVVAWKDFIGTNATPVDPVGHGTGVTGVAAGDGFTSPYDGKYYQGIAPDADLVVLRTDTEKDATPWTTQVQRISNALDWVIANRTTYHIVAMNISTGQGFFSDTSLTGDPYLAIDHALSAKFATLAAAGVFIGASSGNSGATTLGTVEYPAADANVYAAGSINLSGAVSSFTSRGPLMDLLAPGEGVTMPYYFPPGNSLNGTNYVNYGNGTSFSAPAMVGAAALIKQINPNYTPPQIMQILVDSGTSIYDSGTNATYKELNLDAALGLAYARADDLNNHRLSRATGITLSGGQGSLGNLTMLGGTTDYYTFTLSMAGSATVGVQYGGNDGPPTAQLLNSSGTAVGTLAGGGYTARLAAGTYYLSVTSTTTLASPYSVSVNIAQNSGPGSNAATAKTAYDAAGNLHLAWYDSVSQNLKYAVESAGGTWSSVQTVDANPFAGQWVSIAIDPSGKPGIAYYDGYNADLKYAHFNGSSWDISTVDSYRVVGQYPSLAFDNFGTPVIAYSMATYADLKVASYNGHSWDVATVDSAGNVGRSASLAYDAATSQWIVGYEDLTHGWFKAATLRNSVWVPTVVDSTTVAAGGSISMTFTPSHLAAMTYYDGNLARLKYAYSTGRRWYLSTLTGKPKQGLFTNLSFDSSGNADILYWNQTTNSVARLQSASGTWALTTVATGVGYGVFASRAPDGTLTASWLSSAGVDFADV